MIVLMNAIPIWKSMVYGDGMALFLGFLCERASGLRVMSPVFVYRGKGVKRLSVLIMEYPLFVRCSGCRALLPVLFGCRFLSSVVKIGWFGRLVFSFVDREYVAGK